ncbi:MAG: hypothetical protein LBJ46_03170 [Planctomycetota bacterium]|jgi:flagellar biosynthesis/type III secretory pathway M-ring protein FliF/YscJ|nr:hypothetical protein [Planctomycetota bacterium]
MDILRQLWQDAQTVLRDMSTTQRVAVTFLIVAVAGWFTFAAWMGATPSEVGHRPLPMQVEPGDVNDMLARLREKGVASAEYDFDSRRILVSQDEEKKAVIALAEEGLLLGAHQYGFEQMLERWSFADTRLKSEEAMRLARSHEVARLIEQLDPIAEAQVIYSDEVRTTLFGPAQKKSASVRVTTKLQKPLTDDAANTIIAVVSAAKAGLDPRDVVVTDQKGNKFHASSGNSLGAVAKQKWDTEFALNEELRRKLENLMRTFVPNIQYEGDVNAFPKHEVDFDLTEVMYHEVLPGQPSRVLSEKQSARSSSRPYEEPGVNPNVRRVANLNNNASFYVTETSEDRKLGDRSNQNSWRQTATKVGPKVTNLTISAIIHLPYRLKRDAEGKAVQAMNEFGEAIIDPETNAPMWEKETMDPISDDRVGELKRQIAHAAGIPLAEIPEKIEISQVPWTAPVYAPTGAESWFARNLRMLKDNTGNIVLLGVFALVILVAVYFFRRPIPTEVDEPLDEGELSLALTAEDEDEDLVDDEWESLRAKVATAIAEDPKRAANQVKRWMRKD